MKTTPRYALQNLDRDRDQIDTLVTTYALSRSYRYGSDSYRNHGQEKDDEVKGKGNSVNYTYRMHDPRLGRFFAVDPLASEFPWNSVYAFSENRVIDAVELEGLESFIVHGTAMSSAKYIFNPDAIKQFERIGSNSITDDNFSWGSRAGLDNSRGMHRKLSAADLVKHVVATRDRLLMSGEITDNEPITLVGYSHGGNISIQAADEIEKQTGVKVQIITYATPAYNDGSVEDPATHSSISKHIHFYSVGDGVDAIAGGDEKYNNKSSVNYEIPESDIPHGGIKKTHETMGSMSSNKNLGEYLRKTVGAIINRPDFIKSKDTPAPRREPTLEEMKKYD